MYAFSNEMRRLQMEEIAVQAARQAGPHAPQRPILMTVSSSTPEVVNEPEIQFS